MTENSLQLQIKKQERIKIILFILRIILFFNMAGGLFLSIFLLIISKWNLLIIAIIILIVAFLLEQLGTSYCILSFSSAQFMRKNNILLFTYNILTLNILGIILASKFLKDDNYNCLNVTEKQNFENEGSYNNKTLYYNKTTYQLNEAIYYRRRIVLLQYPVAY